MLYDLWQGHCHMEVSKSHSVYLPEQGPGSTWGMWVIVGWREVLGQNLEDSMTCENLRLFPQVLFRAFYRKASSVPLKCFSVKAILPMSQLAVPHILPHILIFLLDCLLATPLTFSHKHLLICYMARLRGSTSSSSACLLIMNSIFKSLIHSCILLHIVKRSHAALWTLCCLDFSSQETLVHHS